MNPVRADAALLLVTAFAAAGADLSLALRSLDPNVLTSAGTGAGFGLVPGAGGGGCGRN